MFSAAPARLLAKALEKNERTCDWLGRQLSPEVTAQCVWRWLNRLGRPDVKYRPQIEKLYPEIKANLWRTAAERKAA